MKRIIGFCALSALIGIIASQTFVLGQDRVERRDKKGGSSIISGKILEENSAGVKIKPAGLGKEETVPSNEIIRMTYSELPAKVTLEIGKLSPAETARDFPMVLKGFQAVQAMPEVKAAGPAARRYIDYRVASLQAMVAEGDEQLKAAIKALVDFTTAHPDTWEFPNAARQLARLQADTADYAGATKSYELIEKAANIPAEFKQEATAALIDIAFQSEKYDDGRKRIKAVNEDAKSPVSLRERVIIYQLGLDAADAKGDSAASIKKIEEAIGKAADPGLKALGYNVLGDVYLARSNKRDAMWSYLWVDVVYNQDRGEHLKAMTRLIKIFEGENDKDKATLYKEKLARSR